MKAALSFLIGLLVLTFILLVVLSGIGAVFGTILLVVCSLIVRAVHQIYLFIQHRLYNRTARNILAHLGLE